MKNRSLFFITTILLALFSLNSNPLSSAPYHQHVRESSLRAKNPKVKVVINKLKKVPESRQLIEEALQGGPITVDLVFKGMPFEAMWENTMRKISIDGRAHRDQGRLLCHLLFELHNAASDSEYLELYDMALNGEIDCDSYVETVEKIEHENMISTVAIIEKGISAGVFPSSARWEIIYDFPTHYKIQQLTEHSLFIAREYQEMSRRNRFSTYRGTVKNLKRMSQREKNSLAGYLYTNYFQTLREEHTFPKEA